MVFYYSNKKGNNKAFLPMAHLFSITLIFIHLISLSQCSVYFMAFQISKRLQIQVLSSFHGKQICGKGSVTLFYLGKLILNACYIKKIIYQHSFMIIKITFQKCLWIFCFLYVLYKVADAIFMDHQALNCKLLSVIKCPLK